MPVFFTSILFGVWGLNIITRMLGPKFPELGLRRKYLALQLVLMANKLQPLIGMIVVAHVDFNCQYPLTTALYKHGEWVVVGWMDRRCGILLHVTLGDGAFQLTGFPIGIS